MNSNVSFKTNLEDHTLHSSSAEISNDSLIIYLTKQTFGIIINVKIYVINDKPSTTISYWTAFGNDSRRLKAEKVILTLKNKELKKGDKLIGRVDIEFRGKLADPDPAAMRDKKIKGRIDGCFNIRVDKFKSR